LRDAGMFRVPAVRAGIPVMRLHCDTPVQFGVCCRLCNGHVCNRTGEAHAARAPLSVIKKPGHSPGYLSNAQEIPASLNLLLLPVKIDQPVEYRIIAL